MDLILAEIALEVENEKRVSKTVVRRVGDERILVVSYLHYS